MLLRVPATMPEPRALLRSRTTWLGLVALAGLAVLVCGYWSATSAPVLRNVSIHSARYPIGSKPLKVALLSDLHVQSPDMPPSRVGRIVQQVNAVRPDIVVLAGDFLGHGPVAGKYRAAEALARLKDLRARLGVYAVLGNTDYALGPADIYHALRSSGVHVLANEAVRVGPLALAGLDGRLHNVRGARSARERTYKSLEGLPGFQVLLVHRPDEFKWSPQSVRLVLSGHTHCGQIVLPLLGPLATGSDFGRDYLCGLIREQGKLLVVTAGLGTSHVPLRIGAPPDIWLITIGR